MVFLTLSEPEHLDPRFPEDSLGANLGRMVSPGLLDTDPTRLVPVARLAAGYRRVSPTAVEVTLREGLRFVDGSPVTAADVVATYRALLAPGSRSRLHGTYAAAFAGVEAEGPRGVHFTLRAPSGAVESLLQMPIVPARLAAGPENLAAPGAEGRFVGASGWRVGALTPQHWRFERQPEDSVAVRSLRVVSLHDPNTLALRLLNGEGDVAEVKPETAALFEHRAGFSVLRARGVGLTYLGIQCEHGPLADPRVRRALGLALDRVALRRARMGDAAVDAEAVLPPTHWASMGAPGAVALRYDPAEARRLLREALGGRGLRPLVLRVSSQRSSLVTAQALAAMLEAVGVEVELRPSELATLLADLRAGRFDLTYLTVPDLTDPWGLGFWFASTSIPENGQTGGNRWRFRDPTLDALLTAGAAASGPEARRPFYVAAQRRLAEGLPVIPLWHPDVVYVLRSPWRVGAEAPRGDGRLDFLAGLRRGP